MKMRNMTIISIMHRKYLALQHYHYNNTITTITVGVTVESAVMPTVIVALSVHHALSPAVIDSDSKQSLQEEEKRPREAKAQDYLCL